MQIIYILFFSLLISKNVIGNNIFATHEYELSFSSNNVNLIKKNIKKIFIYFLKEL